VPVGYHRCAGAQGWARWHSFVGNVLGLSGGMSGYSYEVATQSGLGIWMLGWDDITPNANDPTVWTTALRVGNFDHLTGQQRTHTLGTGLGDATYTQGAPGTLPDSLYLSSKPAFFGAAAWPWVNPATGATTALPAKARFDAGTPNG
jgi:hypothetical protein